MKIGDVVKLNGENYKIVGTVKRSWLLEKDGKNYKCTSNMMKKIQEQNSRGIGNRKRKRTRTERDPFAYLEYHERMRKFFAEKSGKKYVPMTIREKFMYLTGELSPENLCCDGELSRTAVAKKHADIMRAWRACEKEFGRKVSEDEVWDWMIN